MKTLIEMLVNRIPPNTGIPIVKMNMKWSHSSIILRIDRDSEVEELLNRQLVDLVAFIDLCSHM
jgi:hypothetical protein